jgi:hypothetical protein
VYEIAGLYQLVSGVSNLPHLTGDVPFPIREAASIFVRRNLEKRDYSFEEYMYGKICESILSY